MPYLGELISIGVAFSWTIAALSSEVGSKQLGVAVVNVWRLGAALLLSALLLFFTLGTPLPAHADCQTWLWLLASGVVGYFFGDWCLFNSYLTIGSRYGQLFMTLAPMFTALFAWIFIGQALSWKALLAMAVTLTGIAVSVLAGTASHHRLALSLPLRGILFGIGAGLGQGAGLVLSKIGLDHYTSVTPPHLLPDIENVLPFAANMIRCVAGLACFAAWLLASHKLPQMRASLGNRRGLAATFVAVLTGPFIGVGFSLMAVQHTAAGIASTIMAMTPILILLPSRWLFHQPITAKSVVGAVISVIGVSLFFLL